MHASRSLTGPQRFATLWLRGMIGFTVAAGAFLMIVVFADVQRDAGQSSSGPISAVPAVMRPTAPVDHLVGQLVGRRLIRAAEVQAAVKDTGAAQRLLGQLKLQGVVQIDGRYAAYVQVNDRSVQVVSSGDSLLGFIVEAVEPGLVKLSLEGVEAELGY